MAVFSAEMLIHSDNSDDLVDFPFAQDLSSSPTWPNSAFTSSHRPILPHSTSSSISTYSFSGDITDKSVTPAFPDAGSQPYTAQWAEPFQFPQQLQASDNFWTGLDMSDLSQEPQETAQSTESSPSDENAPLRCGVLDCPERQVFSTKAALKRHQDKHIRPYYCHYPSCNRKNFGDKGGLERHKREVHGSQAYKCPVLSCKRHKKGFHRRYNLLEHQRRTHGCSQPSDFLSNMLDQVTEGDARTPTPQPESQVKALEEGGEGQFRSGERRSEDGNAVDSGRDSNFRAKLRALLVMRAELDEDIKSMQRTFNIMGGGESP